MKFLFQPVKPFHINQRFADNDACESITVNADGTHTVINCDGNNPPEGYRSLYADGHHGALDLRAVHGQEVYAAQDGVVYFIDTHPRSGLDVRIEHTVHGEKYRTIYEHLMGYQVKVGDRVRVGQLIGWANNTGYSAGDHLHFQVEKLIDGRWVKVDPEPLLEPIFALDWLKTEDMFAYLKEMLAKYLDNSAYKIRNSI